MWILTLRFLITAIKRRNVVLQKQEISVSQTSMKIYSNIANCTMTGLHSDFWLLHVKFLLPVF